VQATARPGSSLAEIESIVTSEIARLAKEGPTAAEVDRAKNKQESEFISGLERIGGFGGKADVLNQYNTYLAGC
jgi:zinc protease